MSFLSLLRSHFIVIAWKRATSTLFKYSSFMFHRRKNVLWVYNDMRVSRWQKYDFFRLKTTSYLKRPGLNIWDILHILATYASGSIKMSPWQIYPCSPFLHPVKVVLPWCDLSILLFEQTEEVMRVWGHQQNDMKRRK